MKMKAFLIVSRYSEDVSWIRDYTDDYIVYNRGKDDIDSFKTKRVENIGGNQRDIFEFIYENYENLPDLMAFVQGDPFDHCKKEKFDKLIGNDKFTALESYEDITPNGAMRIDEHGGFEEINNSWYVPAHNDSRGQTCKYANLNQFMMLYFDNSWKHRNWIRFTPGSQYIIEKKQALRYPKSFWMHMMNELPRFDMTEAHIIERSLIMILTEDLKWKESNF